MMKDVYNRIKTFPARGVTVIYEGRKFHPNWVDLTDKNFFIADGLWMKGFPIANAEVKTEDDGYTIRFSPEEELNIRLDISYCAG